jgi:hypothetical protein
LGGLVARRIFDIHFDCVVFQAPCNSLSLSLSLSCFLTSRVRARMCVCAWALSATRAWTGTRCCSGKCPPRTRPP